MVEQDIDGACVETRVGGVEHCHSWACRSVSASRIGLDNELARLGSVHLVKITS